MNSFLFQLNFITVTALKTLKDMRLCTFNKFLLGPTVLLVISLIWVFVYLTFFPERKLQFTKSCHKTVKKIPAIHISEATRSYPRF